MSEFVQLAMQLRPCIILGSIAETAEISKLLQVATVLKRDIKQGKIKFIITCSIKQPPVARKFEDLGCQEFMMEPVNERQLQFKMSLQIKANLAARKQHKIAEFKRMKASEGEGQGADAAVKEIDATEIAEDVWAFKGNRPSKKGKKWAFRMAGPDEAQGAWEQHPDKTPEGETQWRWMPKDGPSAKGAWQCAGDKPEHTPQGWGFQGLRPQLKFVDPQGKEIAKKVDTDANGDLITAKIPKPP